MSEIVHVSSPEEFFRGLLTNALTEMEASVPQETERYLVGLLCRYISPEKIVVDEGEYHFSDIPLAFLLKKALESSPETRLTYLQKLGDTSLYLSGFFQNFFHRKVVDLNYFTSLGQTAYSHAAGLSLDGKLSNVYNDLSCRFRLFVETMSAISDGVVDSGKHENVLAVYERWMTHPSDRLFRKLQAQGITPSKVTGSKQ